MTIDPTNRRGLLPATTNTAIAVLAAINQLSLRERLLLLAALSMLITIFWHTVYYQPVKARQQNLANQIQSLQDTVIALEQLLDRSQTQLRRNQDAATDNGVVKLLEKAGQLDKELATKGIILLTDSARGAIEQKLLVNKGNLTLRGIKRLSDKPLLDTSSAQSMVEITTRPPHIIRQQLLIQWQASYHESWRYLKKLETADLPISWDRLQYQSTEPPAGLLTLWVSTFSLQE